VEVRVNVAVGPVRVGVNGVAIAVPDNKFKSPLIINGRKTLGGKPAAATDLDAPGFTFPKKEGSKIAPNKNVMIATNNLDFFRIIMSYLQ
jgi:hypothetical protein